MLLSMNVLLYRCAYHCLALRWLQSFFKVRRRGECFWPKNAGLCGWGVELSKEFLRWMLPTLSIDQSFSTFFVRVHPKNSCDELMHPELKIWNEVKIHFKINLQKDNCTTVCTKNNASQSTHRIQEIIFNDFFAIAFYQPTFYTEIFFNCSPHQWIDVIEFLLRVTRSSLEWEVRDSNLGPFISLRHFFKGSCVAPAQWRGNGPRQLVTRFGVIQRV